MVLAIDQRAHARHAFEQRATTAQRDRVHDERVLVDQAGLEQHRAEHSCGLTDAGTAVLLQRIRDREVR